MTRFLHPDVLPWLGVLVPIIAAIPYLLDLSLTFLDMKEAVVGIVPMLLFYGVLFVAGLLRFDFRGDLDRLDMFKTLPIHPLHISIGQLLPNYLFILLNVVLLTVTASAVYGYTVKIAAVSVFSIPLFAGLIAYLNISMLVYPPPRMTAGAMQLQVMGRILFQMFMACLSIVILLICTASPAAVVYSLTGSLFAALATAWIVCVLIDAALVYGVSVAFDRYDPSKRMA